MNGGPEYAGARASLADDLEEVLSSSEFDALTYASIADLLCARGWRKIYEVELSET